MYVYDIYINTHTHTRPLRLSSIFNKQELLRPGIPAAYSTLLTHDSRNKGEQEMQGRLNKQASKQASRDKYALKNACDTRYGQPNMV